MVDVAQGQRGACYVWRMWLGNELHGHGLKFFKAQKQKRIL